MTMLSFRVDDADAAAVGAWADRLGVDRSSLLRDALRRQLTRLAAEDDIEAWNRIPPSSDEQALGYIADWGPAEDWADWEDGADAR